MTLSSKGRAEEDVANERSEAVAPAHAEPEATDEHEPTPQETREAISELQRVDMVDTDTSKPLQDLMVRAYIRDRGIPARSVGAGEGGAPVPDLTSSDEGRAVLSRLDRFVTSRVRAIQRAADASGGNHA